MEIMVDPVILTDGHVYERSSIERWLVSHNTSPKTNQAVDTRQLVRFDRGAIKYIRIHMSRGG